MLIVIILICFLFILKLDDDFSQIFFPIIFVAAFIMLCHNCGVIVNSRTLDSRIAMYTEENQKIEMVISETVNTYLAHEKETYQQITPESATFFASVYPELKGSELVQKQVQIYILNNEKIKQLKEKKIGVRNAKWWVYFGGGK